MLQGVTDKDFARYFPHQGVMMPRYDPTTDAYGVDIEALTTKPKVLRNLLANRELLLATSLRPPVLNCFGLHEWAMLYVPSETKLNGEASAQATRHQALGLRVSQETINQVCLCKILVR